MEAFVRMFLLTLVFTLGACSKQAPKKEQVRTRVVAIYPCNYRQSVFYDPQDYDLLEEEQ